MGKPSSDARPTAEKPTLIDKLASGVVLAALLGWAGWVSLGVSDYAPRICRAQIDIQALQNQLSEEIKDRQVQMQELVKIQKQDNQKIMELLLDIREDMSRLGDKRCN